MQEQQVLADTQQKAEKLGLDPVSVTPFIRAQIDVAKAIQYRYRADGLSHFEGDWYVAPLVVTGQKLRQQPMKFCSS